MQAESHSWTPIRSANRGILSLSVDGATLGSNLDQYSAAQFYPTTIFGPVTLTEGNHMVRLTVTGKNPASSSYTLSADRFMLVQHCGPVAEPELLRVRNGRGGGDSGCVVPARR
jgi:hypothetical protein